MTCLITGASSGLGERFARLAAADTSDVVLVARTAEKLNTLGERLTREHGVRAIVIPRDLSDPASAESIVSELGDRGVQIDVLINNAGFGTWGPFVETSPDEEHRMITVNILSLTLLTKRLLPGMVARRRGRVMNVASTAAFQPGPLMAVYYASKAYVLSLSEALANEVEGTGVTITCLCPGPTATGFQARAQMGRSRLFRAMSVMDADRVAREGYDGMNAGRAVVIPGLMNKVTAQANRITPRAVVRKIVRRLNSAVEPVRA